MALRVPFEQVRQRAAARAVSPRKLALATGRWSSVLICVMPSGNSASSEAVDVRHRARANPRKATPGSGAGPAERSRPSRPARTRTRSGVGAWRGVGTPAWCNRRPGAVPTGGLAAADGQDTVNQYAKTPQSSRKTAS